MAPKNKVGNLLVEVGTVETRSGKTTSPEFRNKIAKNGFSSLKSEGIETLFDVFTQRYTTLQC